MVKRSTVVFVIAATAVGTSLGLPSRGSYGHAAESAQIAVRRIDGLYLVRSDGTGEHPARLPEDTAWSHDGRWIVFRTESLGAQGYLLRVFVARRDGSQRRQIARGRAAGPCSDAQWSPDDTRMALAFGCDWDFIDLYVARRNGHARLLARGGYKKESYQAVLPSWSPDGRTIVAAHPDPTASGFHLVLLDPSGRSRRIIRGSSFELGGGGGFQTPGGFRWSPDGQSIYFIDDANTARVLYVIGRDGHGRKALSPNHLRVLSFDLSPDGRRIAFTGGDGKNRRIFVMSASGANVHQLTTGFADLAPAWSPDGRFLLFTRDTKQLSVFRITVMKADGSAQHDVSSGSDARWVPGP